MRNRSSDSLRYEHKTHCYPPPEHSITNTLSYTEMSYLCFYLTTVFVWLYVFLSFFLISQRQLSVMGATTVCVSDSFRNLSVLDVTCLSFSICRLISLFYYIVVLQEDIAFFTVTTVRSLFAEILTKRLMIIKDHFANVSIV